MRLALAMVAAALAVGCAAVTTTSTLSTDSNGDRKASADSDARHHLAEFVSPPGARQLLVRPAGADALATDPTGAAPTKSVVTTWWELTSPKAPAGVAGAIQVPAGAQRGDSWGTGRTTTDTWTMSFDWPVVGDVLISRQLLITGTRIGDNIVLRVDGETRWVPDRPKDSLIPSGVASILMTFKPPALGPNPGTIRPYDPITVTDPAQIRTVITLVDEAPVEPYPVRSCPYAGGGKLNLSFRPASDTDVAQADATIDGCDDIYLQIGTAQTTLTGGRDLTNAVISALSIPWQQIR